MATIEIRKDRQGKFRFNIKGRNGEIIATSESYRDRAKARATIKSLQSGAAGARVIDLTVEASSGSGPKAGGSAKKSSKKASKATAKKATKKSAKSSGRGAGGTPAKTAPKKSATKSSAKSAARSSSNNPSSSRGGGSSASKSGKSSSTSARANKATKRSTSTAPSARQSAPAAQAAQTAEADAPRSFNPTRIAAASPSPVIEGDDREDTDDLDVLPGREGADIVTLDELGEGEHISTDLESGNEDDDAGAEDND